MCIAQLQTYTRICQESILISTISYQMLKEKKQTPNMILTNYFLQELNDEDKSTDFPSIPALEDD